MGNKCGLNEGDVVEFYIDIEKYTGNVEYVHNDSVDISTYIGLIKRVPFNDVNLIKYE